MASILDTSDTFPENFFDELSHPEPSDHPHLEVNYEEENMYKDLLDALNSIASPVASHHLGQNFSVLGNTDCDDTDNISCGYIMEAERAAPGELTSQVIRNLSDLGSINSGSSSSNISCNVDGVIMQLGEAAPGEISSQVGQLSVLGYINSDMSSCNVSWTGMTQPNSSSHALLKHCKPDVDVAIEDLEMEEALSHERTATFLDSTEQSTDASQLDKCQVKGRTSATNAIKRLAIVPRYPNIVNLVTESRRATDKRFLTVF
ncbi:hypothetical protein HA402_005607 [Bradysia odoriphaga]|nr:hypothetical protein HA402_005607 [Bradysia odoriphaga]